MKTKEKRILKVILLIIYILLVLLFFYLALQNSSESSNESSKITKVVIKTLEVFIGNNHLINVSKVDYLVRKIIGHFGFSSIIGADLILLLLLSFSLKNDKINIVIALAIILSLFVSITGELLQLLSIGRSCEIIDMLINFTGQLFGMITIFIIYFLKTKRNKNEC